MQRTKQDGAFLFQKHQETRHMQDKVKLTREDGEVKLGLNVSSVHKVALSWVMESGGAQITDAGSGTARGGIKIRP